MVVIVRSAALLLLGYGTVRILAWGTSAPLEAARDGRASLDDLLVLAAAVAALTVLAWVGIVLGGTVLATAPGAAGRTGRVLVQRLTSAGVRRLARAALGLAVTAGPVVACAPAATADLVASGSQPVAAADLPGVAADLPGVAADLPGVGRPGQPIPPPATTEVATGLTDVLGGTGTADPLVQGPQYGPPDDQPQDTPHLDEASPPLSGATFEHDRSGSGAPADVAVVPPTREPAPAEVVVMRGDSLWSIAAAHLGPRATAAEIAAEWPRWHTANRAAIGADPDVILPGTVLQPPDPAGR